MADAHGFFPGFELEYVDVGEVTLRVRRGGSGPAVVLLHGHPRTHVTWHRVAPLLARDFTVVCPDLRGYGKSTKPPAAPGHEAYSKRAMARDCTALMTRLGHERFAVAGHDRGAYVAFRAAMDEPDRITHLAVLDAVPIADALARCDARFATAWWHWFFLGNPAANAERVIAADPDAWYRSEHARRSMGDAAWHDFRDAIHDRETVHAMCEDYRAGLTVDRAHDESDRAAARRVRCPVHVVWAARDDMQQLYGDPRGIWAAWAERVTGSAIDCGHHVAEEAPDALAAALRAFLAS
jgi:haloacetate dehalogenase